jgi:hypothetical protein
MFLRAVKSFAVVGNRTPAHPGRGLVATPFTIFTVILGIFHHDNRLDHIALANMLINM